MQRFPGVQNGIRTLTVKTPNPSFLTIAGYEAKVWYRGQEKTCRVCSRIGHISKNCPEVRCFSCREFGHVASECSSNLQYTYCYKVDHSNERCPEWLEEEEAREKGKKEYEEEMQSCQCEENEIVKDKDQELDNITVPSTVKNS